MYISAWYGSLNPNSFIRSTAIFLHGNTKRVLPLKTKKKQYFWKYKNKIFLKNIFTIQCQILCWQYSCLVLPCVILNEPLGVYLERLWFVSLVRCRRMEESQFIIIYIEEETLQLIFRQTTISLSLSVVDSLTAEDRDSVWFLRPAASIGCVPLLGEEQRW